MTTGVRERAHDAMLAAIGEDALDYVIEHGFASTTVGDLAHAVGISRATFFRYFGSKEDVIVEALLASRADMADIIMSAPGGGSVWALLRLASEPLVRAAEAQPERMRARVNLIGETPSLRARLASRRWDQGEAVATAIGTRLIDPLEARVFAASCFAVLDLAWQRWAHDPTIALRDALDAGFSILERGATVN